VAVAGRRIHQQEQVAPQQLVSLEAVVVPGHRRTQAGQPELEVQVSKVEMRVQTAKMQTFKLVVAVVVPVELVERVHRPLVVPEAVELARP
jgi:hypothetical protein